MIQQHRDKNSVKRILGSKIFLFAAIFILIYLFINLGREGYRKYQLTKEIDSLRAEIEQLEGGNQQLTDLMDYFERESFLEKEVRLKLNLKKPGEKVVILSNYFNSDKIDTSADGNHNTAAEARAANYWKWWEYFFQ